MLFPIATEELGVRNYFIPKLRSILFPLQAKSKGDPSFKLDNLIRLKISGDGTNIG